MSCRQSAWVGLYGQCLYAGSQASEWAKLNQPSAMRVLQREQHGSERRENARRKGNRKCDTNGVYCSQRLAVRLPIR